MGEDLTQEFIISGQQPQPGAEQLQPVEQAADQQEVRTEEALKPFAQVIDRGTAFLINRIITITGEKYEVEIKESDKVRPEEISEIGFGEAVVKVIDYYVPQLPADHPLLGLLAAGTMVGAIAYMKIEQVKARAKPKEENQEEHAGENRLSA
ncbi:hypothetical protein [Archaeoglobus veneficus]|uniref:Uncharacterized protein n=1 Tax=Archaeoglobus veneficus (strain DSM 11195 / SNP6) TaxID=693661 RepID=F2KR38_ARCVS|nr:hypothetical protein [Archaeoglobus veneficus]AEA46675.1 hypothetical protein Arcve_0655 [Archaeoglobus veneficus SNP6]